MLERGADGGSSPVVEDVGMSGPDLRVHVPGTLPRDVVARGARLEDADGVIAMLHAVEAITLGAPLSTKVELVADWQRPSVDLARDVIVVEEADGRIVGSAEQFNGRAFADVHPDRWGEGIGSALATWTEAHARAAGLARVGQTIPTTDGAVRAQRMLAARGYVPAWETWILKRPLADDLPVPSFPAGVTLRSLVRPDDDREVYEVIDTAFNDWPDRDPSMAFEDWRASMLDRDDADHDLLLVAVRNGRMVGAALCEVEDGEGWVDQLAVARSERRQGLGAALLHEAFRRFRARGLRVAALSTDSRTGARSLYERVGMQVTESFVRMALVFEEPAPVAPRPTAPA